MGNTESWEHNKKADSPGGFTKAPTQEAYVGGESGFNIFLDKKSEHWRSWTAYFLLG